MAKALQGLTGLSDFQQTIRIANYSDTCFQFREPLKGCIEKLGNP